MYKKTRIDVDQLLNFITSDEARRMELRECLDNRVIFFTCLRCVERDRFLDFLGPTDQFLKFVHDDWHVMTAPTVNEPSEKETWRALLRYLRKEKRKG